jgi:E3 ubiquitin-protein ligase DOA10
MDDILIKTECYICMESCDEESPCSCATTVHNKCLVQFLDISGNEACTICLDDFNANPIKKTHGDKYILLFILVGGLFFLAVVISCFFLP